MLNIVPCGMQMNITYGFLREKINLQGFANNKGIDQPAHLHSLNRAFVIRFWKVSYLNLVQAKFQISK